MDSTHSPHRTQWELSTLAGAKQHNYQEYEFRTELHSHKGDRKKPEVCTSRKYDLNKAKRWLTLKHGNALSQGDEKKKMVRVKARERKRKSRALQKEKLKASASHRQYLEPQERPSPPRLPRGQAIASALLMAFSCTPLLKEQLLSTLVITSEQLASFESTIAEAWDRWEVSHILRTEVSLSLIHF